MAQSYREWFADRAVPREEIGDFLDGNPTNWMKFDPEVGYVLGNSIQPDGVDGSCSIAHVGPDGARKMVNYADRPCRINSYGDSFTQSHQVSDGETWQEVLAAHLGEAIRNFGVGGFGVYQAYRRMLREEQKCPARNIIFYIWGDDHQRSFMPCRALLTQGWADKHAGARAFHANPWVHLEVDLDAGQIVEAPNSHRTPESLYNLCDPDTLYDSFAHNVIYQLAAMGDGVLDVDEIKVRRLAKWAQYDLDAALERDRWRACSELFRAVGHRGTMFLLDKLTAWAAAADKHVLILLGYGGGGIIAAIEARPPDDQAIIDYLRAKGSRFVDIRERHVEDARDFNLSPEDYVPRYFHGHYSPLGNHFFAFAIKDDVVDWLDPRPPAYRYKGPGVGFDAYFAP